jgi:hypothetical protein
MDDFRRNKIRNNWVGSLGGILFLVLLYFKLSRQDNLPVLEVFLYCSGYGVLYGVFIGLLRKRSIHLVREWCERNGLCLVVSRELPSWERPKDWNFMTIEGEEVEAYEVIVTDQHSKQDTRKIWIAWHTSFVPNPQIAEQELPRCR